MTTILVTGATGTVGAQVVHRLRGSGATVRALVRRPADAARILGDVDLGGVELFPGDLDDAASVRRAVAGADRIFLTAPDGPDKVARERAVIDAAAAAGVELVVKLSALHADPDSPLPAFAWHGAVEQYLHAGGLPAVVLQPSFFMTNLLMVAGGVADTGTLCAPTGGAPVAMIDPGDVAAVAAVCLLDGRHAGETLQLTGPEPVTFHDVAAALSRAVRRPVSYVDLTAEQARPRFEGAGLPEWMQYHLAGVFDLIRAGAFADATATVHEVTGRRAGGISRFADDHAHAFAGRAQEARR
jgi:uncharacterized protein YbjT (DUF2867 family)